MNWRELFKRQVANTRPENRCPKHGGARAWPGGPPDHTVGIGFGWVIELGPLEGHVFYWTGKGRVDFSPRHEDAIRFSRQQDAIIVRDWTLRNPYLRVIQHGWSH